MRLPVWMRFMEHTDIGIEDTAFRDDDLMHKALPCEMRHAFDKAFAIIIESRRAVGMESGGIFHHNDIGFEGKCLL